MVIIVSLATLVIVGTLAIGWACYRARANKEEGHSRATRRRALAKQMKRHGRPVRYGEVMQFRHGTNTIQSKRTYHHEVMESTEELYADVDLASKNVYAIRPPSTEGSRVIPKDERRVSTASLASYTGDAYILGDHVTVEGCGGRVGRVRFVGRLHTEDGTGRQRVGVAFSEPIDGKPGMHNGTHKGHTYFECPANCGTLAKPLQVSFCEVPPPKADAALQAPGKTLEKGSLTTREDLLSDLFSEEEEDEFIGFSAMAPAAAATPSPAAAPAAVPAAAAAADVDVGSAGTKTVGQASDEQFAGFGDGEPEQGWVGASDELIKVLDRTSFYDMYAAILQKEGIDDFDTLLSFNEEELVAYGIKLGHARKLLSVCKDFNPFALGAIPDEAPPAYAQEAYEPVAPAAGPAVSAGDGGDIHSAREIEPKPFFGFDL